MLSVSEHTGPNRRPAAAAMAAASATAWCTACDRAWSSTWAGSPKEKVSELIVAASPGRVHDGVDGIAPSALTSRNVAVTVFVAAKPVSVGTPFG